MVSGNYTLQACPFRAFRVFRGGIFAGLRLSLGGFDFLEGQFTGEVAGSLMTGLDLTQFGGFGAAPVLGVLAARVEFASGRGIRRVRDIALERNALHFVVRVGNGNG